MTAAMVREAARILDSEHLTDAAICSFIEIGSEGAVLRLNAFESPLNLPTARHWLIARDGTSREREAHHG